MEGLILYLLGLLVEAIIALAPVLLGAIAIAIGIVLSLIGGFINILKDKQARRKIGKVMLIGGISAVSAICNSLLIVMPQIRSESNDEVSTPTCILEQERNTPKEEKQQNAETQQTVNKPSDEISNEKTYWVVFHEGFRDGRLEMSTFKADEGSMVIWNTNLVCNSQIGKCDQYYYNNGSWEKIGAYHILTDNALDIIASNADIYSSDGRLLYEKSPYLFEQYDFSGCVQ